MGTGDGQEAQIAAAALAVALCALAIAITQLCGQMLATADGYRRCQPSVMGAWAKYTKLRWKWSQMRFETLYTTPEIFLVEYIERITRFEPAFAKGAEAASLHQLNWVGDDGGLTHIWRPHHMLQSGPYRNVTCLDGELVNQGWCERWDLDPSLELACWLPFLRSIRKNEDELINRRYPVYGLRKDLPRRAACRMVQRSWDFMAPELVRPLAGTNIGDIAIIVQRLGMKWQTFKAEIGEMRAEGDGHIIYSTFVRSLGTILHYAHEPTRSFDITTQSCEGLQRELEMIHAKGADMMRFGLIPTHNMKIEYMAVGTIQEVLATLDNLDPSGTASKKVRDNRQFEPTATHGVSDLIPMVTPLLKLKGSTKIRLPVPMEHPVGLMALKEGFVVFRYRLEKNFTNMFEGSSRASWILETYDSLRGDHEMWEEGVDIGSLNRDHWHEFSWKVHDVCQEATDYFRDLGSDEKNNIDYGDLIASHIKYAVKFWDQAHGNIQRGDGRDHHGLTDWLAEGMHMYWDFLPDIVSDMKRKTNASESSIREAWIMLIFRAFCWSRCHYLGPPHARYPDSTRLSSRYWDSKLPVYLG
ncbi:MAG: hypothetical protein Q9174_003036 [Haloplaca sp. 1 TL-2023]